MADTNVSIRLSADGSQVRNELKLIDQQLQQLGNSTGIAQLGLGNRAVPLSQQASQQSNPLQRQRDRTFTHLYREFLVMRREIQGLNRNLPATINALRDLATTISQQRPPQVQPVAALNTPTLPTNTNAPITINAAAVTLNNNGRNNQQQPQNNTQSRRNNQNQPGYAERNFNVIMGRMTRMLGVMGILAAAQHASHMDYDAQRMAYQTYGSLGTETNYSAAARRAVNWGSPYGYDLDTVLPALQAYQRGAGFNGLTNQQNDITAILKGARAYNIDANSLADTAGRMTSVGTFRAGEQQRFINALAKQIKDNNMRGREREELSVLESINANLATRSATVTQDMMAGMVGFYNSIARSNPNMRGERGGQLANRLVDIANSNDEGFDMAAGLGTTYTGLRGQVELRARKQHDPLGYFRDAIKNLDTWYGKETTDLMVRNKLGTEYGINDDNAQLMLQAIRNNDQSGFDALRKQGQDEGEDEVTKRIKSYQSSTMAVLDTLETDFNQLWRATGEGVNNLKKGLIDALGVDKLLKGLTDGFSDISNTLQTTLETLKKVNEEYAKFVEQGGVTGAIKRAVFGEDKKPDGTPAEKGFLENVWDKISSGHFGFEFKKDNAPSAVGTFHKQILNGRDLKEVQEEYRAAQKAKQDQADKILASMGQTVPLYSTTPADYGKSAEQSYDLFGLKDKVKGILDGIFTPSKASAAELPGKTPEVKGAYYNAETGEFKGIDTTIGLKHATGIKDDLTQGRRLTENTNRGLAENTEALLENTKLLGKTTGDTKANEDERFLISQKENAIRQEQEGWRNIFTTYTETFKQITEILKGLVDRLGGTNTASAVASSLPGKTNSTYDMVGGKPIPGNYKNWDITKDSGVTAETLNTLFKGGSLEGKGADWIKWSREEGIDPLFMAAIIGRENGYGRDKSGILGYKGSEHNIFSLRYKQGAPDEWTHYDGGSYEANFRLAAKNFKREDGYYNIHGKGTGKRLNTPSLIAPVYDTPKMAEDIESIYAQAAKIQGGLPGVTSSQMLATKTIPKGGMTPDALKAFADPWVGKKMVNGVVGCVEAAIKMTREFSKFSQENISEVNVKNLRDKAAKAGLLRQYRKGDPIPAGSIMGWYDDKNSHVVVSDGKGGYYGNSSYADNNGGYVVHKDKQYYLGDPQWVIDTGQDNDLVGTPAINTSNVKLDAANVTLVTPSTPQTSTNNVSQTAQGNINSATGYANKPTYASHGHGLKNVPFDLYPAQLHKGERVLTKNEAKQLRDLEGLVIPDKLKIDEELDSIPEIKRKRELQEQYKDVTSYSGTNLDNFYAPRYDQGGEIGKSPHKSIQEKISEIRVAANKRQQEIAGKQIPSVPKTKPVETPKPSNEIPEALKQRRQEQIDKANEHLEKTAKPKTKKSWEGYPITAPISDKDKMDPNKYKDIYMDLKINPKPDPFEGVRGKRPAKKQPIKKQPQTTSSIEQKTPFTQEFLERIKTELTEENFKKHFKNTNTLEQARKQQAHLKDYYDRYTGTKPQKTIKPVETPKPARQENLDDLLSQIPGEMESRIAEGNKTIPKDEALPWEEAEDIAKEVEKSSRTIPKTAQNSPNSDETKTNDKILNPNENNAKTGIQGIKKSDILPQILNPRGTFPSEKTGGKKKQSFIQSLLNSAMRPEVLMKLPGVQKITKGIPLEKIIAIAKNPMVQQMGKGIGDFFGNIFGGKKKEEQLPGKDEDVKETLGDAKDPKNANDHVQYEGKVQTKKKPSIGDQINNIGNGLSTAGSIFGILGKITGNNNISDVGTHLGKLGAAGDLFGEVFGGKTKPNTKGVDNRPTMGDLLGGLFGGKSTNKPDDLGGMMKTLSKPDVLGDVTKPSQPSDILQNNLNNATAPTETTGNRPSGNNETVMRVIVEGKIDGLTPENNNRVADALVKRLSNATTFRQTNTN